MKTIHSLCFFIALLGPAAFQDSETSSQIVACSRHQKCRDCINAGCQWCADSYEIIKGSLGRCFPTEKQHPKCRFEYVYPKRDQPTAAVEQNVGFGNNVLFRPQNVRFKLNVGEKFSLNLTYKHSYDYPVDLYYLMDLSRSMDDDKTRLSNLGNSLADTMRKLTKDFQLGFGSFVDKVILPYTSTSPDKLDQPCETLDKKPCASPYNFKNHLKLNTNTSLFSMEVQKARVSGNLDSSEGGIDAVMQAIVCKDQIGWRDKARHLLVYSTDAGFHFAGDGRLAGLLKPNDMKCHLTNDGNYTDHLSFDYPSISQISQVSKEHNINLIFAVTDTYVNLYRSLADRIEGASAAKLEYDSSNVVQLVKEEYMKILGNVRLNTNVDGEHIKIHFNSSCSGDIWKETDACDELKQGQEINFTATIQVIKCPNNNQRKWEKMFTIKPKGIDTGSAVVVNLEIICDCPCESPGSKGYEPNSASCSNNGTLSCGVCDCNPGFHGDKCQCGGNSNNPDTTEDNCKKSNDTLPCSGYGDCVCGICVCYNRTNKEEHHYGQYCDCDDFTCPHNNGLLCAGPDHGVCECGECICKWGWTGYACHCPISTEKCIEPGKEEICSGRGSCDCGVCKCDTPDGKLLYSGQYCEKCMSCPGEQCEDYKSLVECRVFETGSLSKEECYSDQFSDIEIVEVDHVDDPEEEIRDTVRVCRIPDDSGCTFIFRYIIGNKTLEVQRTKVCGSSINVLALVLGLIGGIVLIGLLLLLIWKIVTTIHDSREFAKFENERAMAKWERGDNPLYKRPTSVFTNPTFGKEE